jgi:hypothetical protein
MEVKITVVKIVRPNGLCLGSDGEAAEQRCHGDG